MNRTITLITVLLAIIALNSMVMTETASAQSIPKPAVPQFSIQVVDHSYDNPTTYTTDPYSGKQTANPGYHVDDIRVEGKIKNQPFTPYNVPNPDSTSNYDTYLDIEFYYNISFRGHFGGEWRKLLGTEDDDYLKQNYGSENTPFNLSRNNAAEFHEGDQIDVRVSAFIGYETWGFTGGWPYRILNGEDSGWSSTLTVTISKDPSDSNIYASTIDNSPYPTITTPPTTAPTLTQNPSSTPTPSVPELSGAAIMCLLVALPLIAGVVVKTKISKQNKLNPK
jgi:hypothetical protein